eukprot:1159982-Pelagomonas_calceolata.AAC.2
MMCFQLPKSLNTTYLCEDPASRSSATCPGVRPWPSVVHCGLDRLEMPKQWSIKENDRPTVLPSHRCVSNNFLINSE